jgi:hypothetical protein
MSKGDKMAKGDKKHAKELERTAAKSKSAEASGRHHGAKAHGQPATVDASLPASRDELLALHAAARRRRSTAELGSPEHRAAVDDIGRIEVRIADVERPMTPPRG